MLPNPAITGSALHGKIVRSPIRCIWMYGQVTKILDRMWRYAPTKLEYRWWENFSWLWSDGSTGQYLRTKVLGKHWVNVVDDYGCEASDTIMVNAYSGVVDALVDVKLENVSVDTAKQENIDVAWTVIHPEKIPDNTVSVYKRISGDSQWEFASTIDSGMQFYANPGNATSDNSYEFYVALADHCLTEQRQSLIHNSILLNGVAGFS